MSVSSKFWTLSTIGSSKLLTNAYDRIKLKIHMYHEGNLTTKFTEVAAVFNFMLRIFMV